MRLTHVIALIALTPNVANATDGLRCQDFMRRKDGSWKNVRDVDTSAPDHPKGFHFPKGLVFEEGNILDGLDVAGVLNRRCRR